MLHQGSWQELGGTRVNHGHAAQHLTHDDLDVLVVDGHALVTVDLLHFVDQVLLHATAAEYAKNLVRIGRALEQLLTHLDVVTIAQWSLHSAGAQGCEPLTLGQFLVHNVFGAIVGNDRDRVEGLVVLDLQLAIDRGDGGLGLWHTSFEELLHTWKTTRNVATHTTEVEGTHGQLGTWLANGLCSHNAHGLADFHLLAGRHRASVAGGAQAGCGGTGHHGAYLNELDASVDQTVHVRLVDNFSLS